MATDIGALLAQLPPGGDIFESVQLFLDHQIYPVLGSAFWAQAYVVLALLGASGIVFIVGLAVKAKRGKLNLIVHDGSCSRLDLKFVAPILWTIAVGLQIAFSVSFKRCLVNQRYTSFMGAIWFLVYTAPAVSYALLSASVAANAPPVRRYLSRLPYGVVWYNGAVLLVVAATLVGTIIPAMRHARSMQGLSDAHALISKSIQDARARQDIAALMATMDVLPVLGPDLEYRAAVRLANSICASFQVFYMVTGAVPAIVLGRLVYRKIARLQGDLSSTIDTYNMSGSGTERIDLTITAKSAKQTDDLDSKVSKLPEQPKDRPFAQLVEMRTTTYPARFHAVMQAEEHTALERAANLRAIIKTDLGILVPYFLALLTFFGGCLFLACDGLDLLDTRGDLMFGYAYFSWNFAINASGLAGLLLLDAIREPYSLKPYKLPPNSQQKSKFSAKSTAPTASTIECSQIVNISYARDDEPQSPAHEKKHMYTSRIREV